MEITQIKIRKLLNEDKLRGIVSVTFDNVFAVHDIKIVEGTDRMFVAMPSRKDENGKFRDVVHPINAQFRQETENEILDYFKEYVKEVTNEEEALHNDSKRIS